MSAPIPKFDISMLDAATALLLQHQGAARYPDDRLELLIAPNYLSAEECAIFVKMIDQDCTPSRVAYEGVPADWRTSETCYFSDTLPIIDLLELRLSLFFNIHPAHGERIQGQRYRVGQEFKSHTDYFPEGHAGSDAHIGASGNRTWTGMIYLNEPDEGGETFFPHLKHAFVPQQGTMVAWNNLKPDGRGNPMTLHHGMPVVRGSKYVLTKWYRQGTFIR